MIISIQQIIKKHVFLAFLCVSVFSEAQIENSNSESNEIASNENKKLQTFSVSEESTDQQLIELKTSETNLPVTTIQRHIVMNSNGTTSDEVSVNCKEVELAISFDEYAEDISWIIVDSSNNLVASANRYASYPKQKILAMKQCLTPGTYTFIIKDKNEDGLCCQWSRGFYHLYLSDGTSLASGASFGSRETTVFTINDSKNSENNASVDRVQTTEQFEYSVFPSPVTSGNLLQIVAPGVVTQYTIYDRLGKKIKDGRLQQNTVNVNDLEAGIYFLTINVANRPITLEFVKS